MLYTIAERRNAGALRWLRALAFAGGAFLGLAAPGFYPSALVAILAAAVGVLGLLSPAIGVLALIVAVSIPLLAADVLTGVLFLVLGFGMLQYLSDLDGRVFLVIAAALAATLVKAEWGVAVLAGYLLGASEGAIAAFVACLVVQAAGFLVGAASLGTLTTGGSAALVDLGRLAHLKDPLSFGWFMPGLARVDPSATLAKVMGAKNLGLLAVQPLLWAGAAAATGLIVAKRPANSTKPRLMSLGAAAAITIALGVLSVGASAVLKGSTPSGTLAPGLGAALVVMLSAAAASEWVFTPVARKSGARGSAGEDADVDELLRTISSAEEKLASKHTASKTVLITDMKSFSRLTEDLGSTETAKLVQRHRDLLLPIVEGAGGHGKSTGGDGLLAAFDSPASALDAAVRMQRALADYNASRPGGEWILIRAGIASGEVVLDKSGRPFLGGALNLAARVMSLADGGQVFTTKREMDAVGGVSYSSVTHGVFRLKNIAEPVEIIEVLWQQDQEPRPPLRAHDED